jgi:hypothetical protein
MLGIACSKFGVTVSLGPWAAAGVATAMQTAAMTDLMVMASFSFDRLIDCSLVQR